MTTLVYVINKNGNPLMPCKPAKARHLLCDGRAKVIKRCPFTIQLLWDCEENIQPTTLGIDKGSKFTGFSIVNDETGESLLQIEVRHRLDVKDKMESRRNNRKARRSRKWYRPCRFNNRGSSRRKGRLPQSVKTNADEVLRVVRKLLLPLNKIIVEDVLVDIRKLTDTNIKDMDYQKSNRLNENLRLACLMRDGFKCQKPKCKHITKSLHAHHIVPRSEGGADTITNLITLCKKCHSELHLGRWKLSITGASGFKDQIAQRTMQGKTYLYKNLRELCPDLELVYGYQTAERRHSLSLEKTHMVDAFVIAKGTHYSESNQYKVNFRPRQTRRQFYDLPQKGKGRVRYQVNEELDGFSKGDVVWVITKEGQTFVKQIKSILSARAGRSSARLAFSRVKGEPGDALSRNCKLLEKCKTLLFKKLNKKG